VPGGYRARDTPRPCHLRPAAQESRRVPAECLWTGPFSTPEVRVFYRDLSLWASDGLTGTHGSLPGCRQCRFVALKEETSYSYLRATIGSTRMARRAGM